MPEHADEELRVRAEREIVALHVFFEQWFRGELAGEDASLGPLALALDPSFEIISPRGTRDGREAILQAVGSAPGTWAPEDRIWIEDVRVVQRAGPLTVVTYEEWQTRGEQTRGRLSTVVFRDDPAAPRNLVWLHLHEVWLPDH